MTAGRGTVMTKARETSMAVQTSPESLESKLASENESRILTADKTAPYNKSLIMS